MPVYGGAQNTRTGTPLGVSNVFINTKTGDVVIDSRVFDAAGNVVSGSLNLADEGTTTAAINTAVGSTIRTGLDILAGIPRGMGSLAEIVFAPFIADKLKLNNLEKNGSDDLSNPETFKRTGDADLIDKVARVRIDVQCGTGEGEATIKKHKFDHAAKTYDTTYIFLAGLLTGDYALVNLKDLTNIRFEVNQRWEGTLCWTVPEKEFKPYYA